jgi:hypothetical protein
LIAIKISLSFKLIFPRCLEDNTMIMKNLQILSAAGIEVDISESAESDSVIDACLNIFTKELDSENPDAIDLDWLDNISIVDCDEDDTKVCRRVDSMVVIYRPKKFSLENLRRL